MKFSDLPINEDYFFVKQACILTKKPSFQKLKNLQGSIKYKGGDDFQISSPEGIVEFSFEDLSESKRIQDYLSQRQEVLIEITQITWDKIEDAEEKKKFFATIVVFSMVEIVTKWEICITEEILEQVRKLYGSKVSEEKIYSEMKKNLLCSHEQKSGFAFSAGSYDTTNSGSGKKRTICIYGRDYSVLVQMERKNDNHFMTVKRIEKFPKNIPAMRLVWGEISFSSEEKYISNMAKKILEEDAQAGYTKIWEKYANQEGDFLFKKAREIGILSINQSNSSITSDGKYRCNLIGNESDTPLKELVNLLGQSGGKLCLSDVIPRYLEELDLTWNKVAGLKKQAIQIQHVGFEIDKQGSLTLDIPEYPMDKPYISWDITGDVRQIQRREKARQRIVDGTAANPLMGLVINGSLPKDMGGKPPKIDSISYSIQEKIFKNPPTPVQLEAIDLAINTPDIAVIQGPPGTGKTTVITAVIERLNQLADKKQLRRGEVLVTSFQHDAVRNVIERMKINSLPTIKYGRKGDLTQYEAVDLWCDNLQQKIEDKNPSFVTHVHEDKLHQSFRLYINAPTTENAKIFLKIARYFAREKDLEEEIMQLEAELPIQQKYSVEKFHSVLKNLRVTQIGFEDDGNDRAADLLTFLEDEFSEESLLGQIENLNLLKKACFISNDKVNEALLTDLSKLQLDLLSRLTPPMACSVRLPNEEITNLYPRLRQKMKQVGNPKDEILFELLQELRENRVSVTEAVGAYSFVFASTTQQSMGTDIKKAKSQTEEDLSYQTVVVDEAARVNPGDLMIPLAQAKRRVILVGDHRQLPHIYDEEVFEALSRNEQALSRDEQTLSRHEEQEKTLEYIETTMFQYLIEQAKKLTRADSIPRFITLDRQYRMHPLLGQFVSDNFYAKYGEEFQSPLDSSYFQQNLEEKPLVWVDVSHDCGEARRISGSWGRSCEVNYILDQICIYLSAFQTEEEKATTFGVISFYSQQVKALERKKNEKIKEYPHLASMLHNVRIGSVDSFQGMEFDVIFLSVVRSHSGAPRFQQEILCQNVFESPEEEEQHKKYVEQVGMSHYGFLTSENRLCVSLSRQKKLLVVVGNASIFHENSWGTMAESCIPAMKNLYHLCKTEGIVRRESCN